MSRRAFAPCATAEPVGNGALFKRPRDAVIIT